jgi:hypothetical protein
VWQLVGSHRCLASPRTQPTGFGAGMTRALQMQTNPDIIYSPLSGEFTRDGITVTVEIYRLSEGGGWALEVTDDDDASTLWKEEFVTDQAAFELFVESVAIEGLRSLLTPNKRLLH